MKVAITIADGRTEPTFVVIENAELYTESQLTAEFVAALRRNSGVIPTRPFYPIAVR